jgi:hypothetical protein
VKKQKKKHPYSSIWGRSLFFDLSLSKMAYLLYGFVSIAWSASFTFPNIPAFKNHVISDIIIFVGVIEPSFFSLYLIKDFIKVGKNFKRITGKFTWKPPKGY